MWHVVCENERCQVIYHDDKVREPEQCRGCGTPQIEVTIIKSQQPPQYIGPYGDGVGFPEGY